MASLLRKVQICPASLIGSRASFLHTTPRANQYSQLDHGRRPGSERFSGAESNYRGRSGKEVFVSPSPRGNHNRSERGGFSSRGNVSGVRTRGGASSGRGTTRATNSKSGRGGKNASDQHSYGRRKLAPDLNPPPRSGGLLKVAPRERDKSSESPRERKHTTHLETNSSTPKTWSSQRTSFSRDDAPHSNNTVASRDTRDGSFRSRTRPGNKLDWSSRQGRWDKTLASPKQKEKVNIIPPASQEFFHPPSHVMLPKTEPLDSNSEATTYGDNLDPLTQPPVTSLASLPQSFTSPPLMPGLLSCVQSILGPRARPTPIQALSLKWVVSPIAEESKISAPSWKEFLLASETGSGKSIAYLLPVLQSLKQSELNSTPRPPLSIDGSFSPPLPRNPRGLILAPTHELSRQLAAMAKSLLHEVKLRVQCASRANVSSGRSSSMAADVKADSSVHGGGGHPIDLMVGTPMKLLDMCRGRGWDRLEEQEAQLTELEPYEFAGNKDRASHEKMRRVRTGRPEMGLANVEWVVIDEADVLFDPDFKEHTLALLSDIAAARGVTVSPPSPTTPPVTPPASPLSAGDISTSPTSYPFNLLLTSATIPVSLATHLSQNHPAMVRLASPNLHRLPKSLNTEYVSWTGGNKFADVEKRVREVWRDDAIAWASGDRDLPSTANQAPAATATRATATGEMDIPLSKILIFCNKGNKVDELGTFLAEKGIKNIALSGASEARKRGSNHHLDGFLRSAPISNEKEANPHDPSATPHVLITTSLLSRGLDFAPFLRHVFIVDAPRNQLDFLHRAGRSGRAGEQGTVVVFRKGGRSGTGW